MTPVFSGGIVYEYFEDPENDYGLVTVVGGSVTTMSDYNAFSTQMASVAPSPTQMSAYNPTNTAGSSCPSVSANYWDASPNLPPSPNKDVCACMVSGLTCKVKGTPSNEAIGTLFNIVYSGGKTYDGIARYTANGTYGLYSMCSAADQLSYAFNAYYNGLSTQNKATGCDFGGNATLVSNAAPASSCTTILSSASASVSSAAGTGSSNGAAASTSKKNDAGALVGPTLGMGPYFAVGFTLMATLSGAGMVLL
jgi:hypothetical protein